MLVIIILVKGKIHPSSANMLATLDEFYEMYNNLDSQRETSKPISPTVKCTPVHTLLKTRFLGTIWDAWILWLLKVTKGIC